MKRIDGLCLMCKEKEATALHHLISDRVYLAMLRYELGVTTTLGEMQERFKFIGSIKKRRGNLLVCQKCHSTLDKKCDKLAKIIDEC